MDKRTREQRIEIVNRIKRSGRRSLTLVYKSGIVAVWDIICDTESNNIINLIHGGTLYYLVDGVNMHHDPLKSDFDMDMRYWQCEKPIKDFKAVYIDGVQIVKNGKIYGG